MINCVHSMLSSATVMLLNYSAFLLSANIDIFC